MNLKLIDRVIASYTPTLAEEDVKRLEFFRGLWGDMDRWSKGPSAAVNNYTVPAAETLEAAWHDDRPVFSFAAPKLSLTRTCAICSSLRTYVCGAGVLSEEDAKELEEVDFNALLTRDDLAEAASNPEQFIGKLLGTATKQGISENVVRMVALVVMHALRVDFEPIAKAIMKAEPRNQHIVHNPLHCPVCGGDPGLARVGGADSPTEGRGRTLYCATCGTQWDFERIRCARCGTKNQGHLHFFNVEGDDEHRIATCDECGGYIRSVYIDDPLHPFSNEVEEVVTARLDAIARDPKFHIQDDK